MDAMKAAAKRRAMRKANREPGDMGEKPDYGIQIPEDPGAFYIGDDPERQARQPAVVNIQVGRGGEPSDHETSEGVARLHATLRSAAKRRANRRTAR